ncbi:hypothetical protein RQP46_003433 [Phenoliferia psychrophenolica]
MKIKILTLLSILCVSAAAGIPAKRDTTSSTVPTTTAVSALGALEYSVTSAYKAPSPTAIALQPTPTLNGTAQVDYLWSLVEAQIPVEVAGITEVVEVPDDYSFGPDPPSYALRAQTSDLKFPKGFLFGVASAAIQVEGAAKADGRGPSSWDYLCHNYPDSQCNNFAPDVTTNFYNLYKIDLARIKHLEVNAFSFSVSWPRIFPLGSGSVNEAGLAFYGGWEDTGDQIVKDFVAYATVLFKKYGNKVTKWVTFNEPRRGVIGFKSDDNYPIPARNGTEDETSATRHGDFRIGIFAQPVYGDGDYPDSVKETLGSMLPALSEEDKSYIKGSADFFALDGYRTDISRAALNGIEVCAKNQSDPNWPVCEEGSNAYAHSYPAGWAIGQLVNTAPFIRGQLKNLVERFPAKEGIYFSEFGFAEPFEYDRSELYQITWDGLRYQYNTDYLNELLLAIHEDGIDVRGAFAWSYIDNWEWALGLQQKFGMQYVNHTDPALPRSYKLSAFGYRDFGRAHLQTAPLPTATDKYEIPLSGAAGYSCIAFDYRGFGSSSGSSRQILNWERQQEDWHRVIAWARERPDIEKIGLFGTSFGGGHVISIAAKDKRVAAAISQCPFTHGTSSALTVGYWVGLKLVALMNAPDVMAGYHRLAPASLRGRFPETVAARVVLEFLYNAPGWYAREVDCPIFFAVCGQDSVAPPGATLAYAKEAKRGVVKQYHEMSHFTIYHDEHFKTATADYLNFLADVLPIAPEPPSFLVL